MLESWYSKRPALWQPRANNCRKQPPLPKLEKDGAATSQDQNAEQRSSFELGMETPRNGVLPSCWLFFQSQSRALPGAEMWISLAEASIYSVLIFKVKGQKSADAKLKSCCSEILIGTANRQEGDILWSIPLVFRLLFPITRSGHSWSKQAKEDYSLQSSHLSIT
jgi:hypothetical protein